MKPVTAFDNFPSFANAGTRSAPAEAKYAQGMVPADTLPAEWANYFFHGATKGVSDLNSAVRSIWQELQNILTEYNITPSSDSSVINQLYTALTKVYPKITTCDSAANTATKALAITGNVLKTGDIYVVTMTNENSYGDGSTTWPKLSINSGTAYDIVYQDGTKARNGAWKAGEIVKFLFMGDKFLMEANPLSRMYPVGSIYQNKINPTNPATLFGFGTWQEINDKFLVSASHNSFSDTEPKYEGVNTAVRTSVTLEIANLPSHSHPIGGNTGDGTASFTIEPHKADITVSHNHSHTFPIIVADRSGGLLITRASYDSGPDGNMTTRLLSDDNPDAIWCTVYDNGHNHGVTQSPHTHPLPANTGNTGSATAFSIIPSYQAVYTWYRSA